MNRQSRPARDQRMRELMDHDRAEEAERPAQGHEPVDFRRQTLYVIRKNPRGPRPSYKNGDDQPAQIDSYFEAEQFEKSHFFPKHRPASFPKVRFRTQHNGSLLFVPKKSCHTAGAGARVPGGHGTDG